MTIAYYPIEPDVPPVSQVPVMNQQTPVSVTQEPPSSSSTEAMFHFQNETSECNYLVLFFVVGVLFLAFTDSMKRS